MKKSSIDWLFKEMNMLRDKLNKLEISQSDYNVLSRNISKTAREMHRKEIEEARVDGCISAHQTAKVLTNSQYYNETFDTNDNKS